MLQFSYHMSIFIISSSFIFVNCSSPSEKLHSFDSNAVIKKLQLSEDEIFRRRKLVEPYLLEIENDEKDWIETYHLSFGDTHVPAIKKYANLDSNEYSPHGKISPKDESDERNGRKQSNSEGKLLKNHFNHDGRDLASSIGNTEESSDPFSSENSNLKSILNTETNINKASQSKVAGKDDSSEFKIASQLQFEEFQSKKSQRSQDIFSNAIIFDSLTQDNANVKKQKEESVVPNLSNSPDNIEFNNEDFKLIDSLPNKPDAVSNYRTLETSLNEDIVLSSADSLTQPYIEDMLFTKVKQEKEEAEIHVSYAVLNDQESFPHSQTNLRKSETGKELLVDSKVYDSKSIGSFSESVPVKNYIDKFKSFNTNFCRNEFYSMLIKIKSKKYNSYKGSPVSKNDIFKKTGSFISELKENEIYENIEVGHAIVSGENAPFVSDELFQRQKLVKSYMTTLKQGREKWKETYNFEEINSDWKSAYDNFNKEESKNSNEKYYPIAEVLSQAQSPDRIYLIRWLKMFLQKIDESLYSENLMITFPLTSNSLNNLKMLILPEKFDIKTADEIISNLISNVSVHYDYNFYTLPYTIPTSLSLYILLAVIVLLLSYFILSRYHHMQYRYMCVLFFLICILWHGVKMYQEKVSEKHATLSGTAPEYCESILNKESGIFAHFKELIRYNVHNDHCKKYYEAIMVDPASELSVFIVVSDFIASTIFQIFKPMSRALNVFVKNLFYDLHYSEVLYMMVLLTFFFFFCIICVLIYNKYKLNFPFFMGSLEPSAVHLGSRVQDLAIGADVKKENPLKEVLPDKNKSINNTNVDFSNSLMLSETDSLDEKSKMLVRRCSL